MSVSATWCASFRGSLAIRARFNQFAGQSICVPVLQALVAENLLKGRRIPFVTLRATLRQVPPRTDRNVPGRGAPRLPASLPAVVPSRRRPLVPVPVRRRRRASVSPSPRSVRPTPGACRHHPPAGRPLAAAPPRFAATHVVASTSCPDCYRLEQQLPGGFCARWETAPFHGVRSHEVVVPVVSERS